MRCCCCFPSTLPLLPSFTADTSSVFKGSKYFKIEQSDISREIGWLDPSTAFSSTRQQQQYRAARLRNKTF
ncbi:unnamed protein product [Musa acuminata subsp. burmannicoides]